MLPCVKLFDRLTMQDLKIYNFFTPPLIQFLLNHNANTERMNSLNMWPIDATDTSFGCHRWLGFEVEISPPEKNSVNFGTEIFICFGKMSNFFDSLFSFFCCKQYLRITHWTEAPQGVLLWQADFLIFCSTSISVQSFFG